MCLLTRGVGIDGQYGSPDMLTALAHSPLFVKLILLAQLVCAERERRTLAPWRTVQGILQSVALLE
eukprot:IDg14061t1